MKKLFFSAVVDSVLNRVGTLFGNVMLRRAMTHVASSEAAHMAEIEARIAELQEAGHSHAAARLSAHLEQLGTEDPSRAMTTQFGQTLLADTYVSEDSQNAAISAPEDRPQRGRRRKTSRLESATE